MILDTTLKLTVNRALAKTVGRICQIKLQIHSLVK